MNYRIIFTGGPGSGKSSVIERLNRFGYPSAPEVGRKVIQTQVKAQGIALPWKDKTAFRDQMVVEEINHYHRYGDSDITFFDRSIIDSYGYSKLENIPIPELLLTQCRELIYYQDVFMFPPWQDIYQNDGERKQTFDQAVATYHQMVSAYIKFGYHLIEVPKISVDERAEFIINNLSFVE